MVNNNFYGGLFTVFCNFRVASVSVLHYMPLVTSIAHRELREQYSSTTTNPLFSSEAAANVIADHEVHYHSYTHTVILFYSDMGSM